MSDPRASLESARAFLDAPRCAVLSTLGSDGAPRQIVIHYGLGDDHVSLNGHCDRRWIANARRDPRVSLVVHDVDEPLHYVSVRGRAAVVDEGAEAVREAMEQARRYGEEPGDYADQPRVSVRVSIDRVVEYRA